MHKHNECRKDLFSRKGRLPEELPPNLDAGRQVSCQQSCVSRKHCWTQSLLKDPVLPDPNEWGWKIADEGYNVVWTTTLVAPKICQELIRCEYNIEKCCKGRCKCVKASLKCTALYKCRGDCER